MTDFKKIMDHGFVVYSGEANTLVSKVITPASPNCAIAEKTFTSYEAAIDFCEKFVKGGIEEANLQEARVQLAYNPTGLHLKAKNLENIKAASYSEAMEMATQQAMDFFKKEGIVKKVGDNFEVKVIPVT